MTINQEFNAESKVVERDSTRELSYAEIDEYSIRYYIQQRLNALNWTIDIKPMYEGWPDYEDVVTPGIYVEMRRRRVSGVELGSHGSSILTIVEIFTKNPAQRTRLAELVEDVFRDTVPVFDYVTGNETNPSPTGEYFITDDVGWEKIPSVYNGPDTQRWRAVVTASLRRVE